MFARVKLTGYRTEVINDPLDQPKVLAGFWFSLDLKFCDEPTDEQTSCVKIAILPAVVDCGRHRRLFTRVP